MTDLWYLPDDSSLPDLRALFPDKGAPAFVVEAASELTGQVLAGASVEITYMRYWPRRRCVVQWTLETLGPPLVVSAEMNALEGGKGSFEGEGRYLESRRTWLQVFPHDRVLPGLETAVSPSWIATSLAPRLGLEASAGLSVRPVSYKSWRRCVVEYRAGSDASRVAYFGKLFRDDRGEVLSRRLSELAAALESSGNPWRVPETTFYSPETRMLVQRELAGVPLSTFAQSAPEDTAARQNLLTGVVEAAQRLLGLQALELDGLECVDASQELESLRQDIDSISLVAPDPAEMLRGALAGLEAVLKRAEPEAMAVSHGAFRVNHIYRLGDDLALLDLDSLARAGTNADAGYFLAYLAYSGLRRRRLRGVLAECEAAFVENWRRSEHYSPEWLAFHRVAVLLRWAVRSFFSLDKHWPELVEGVGAISRQKLAAS